MKTLQKLTLVAGFAAYVNLGAQAQTVTSNEFLYIKGNPSSEGGEISIGDPNDNNNLSSWRIDNQNGNMRFFRRSAPVTSQNFIDFMQGVRITSSGQLVVGSFANFTPYTLDPSISLKSMGKTHLEGLVQVGSILANVPSDVKLSVNGRIYTTGIKVMTNDNINWPDFVFAKNYKLRSLEEVENYITENSHLPEVPSEAEVKANGIDMSEMMKIQMQKIEELTLYIIQQQKEIDALKKANK